MPSIGHIAVGMAAARLQRPMPSNARTLLIAMAFWSVLSVLPDGDIVGRWFGIRNADSWGHRGASHSLAFALGTAVAVALAARWRRTRLLRGAFLAFAVVASHGLLDAMTNGGRGVALLWPLDTTRYFAPWRPIPVAPLGLRFFSEAGLSVALRELVLFAPVFVYALWPRARPSETP
jgi:inner membrane protein